MRAFLTKGNVWVACFNEACILNVRMGDRDGEEVLVAAAAANDWGDGGDSWTV